MIKRRIDTDGDFYPTQPSSEAKICLNCPLPECIENWNGCEYFRKERKRLRVQKNEKRNKKAN